MTSTALVPQTTTDLANASLPELEAVIERGQQTFYEVGAALLTIRERRLYRDTHATFEDYCQERWDFGRHYANRLIESAEVIALLVPIGTKPPTNEAQVRELSPLKGEPEAVEAVWREANERAAEREQPVTAAVIREVREERAHRERPAGPRPIEHWPAATREAGRLLTAINEQTSRIQRRWQEAALALTEDERNVLVQQLGAAMHWLKRADKLQASAVRRQGAQQQPEAR